MKGIKFISKNDIDKKKQAKVEAINEKVQELQQKVVNHKYQLQQKVDSGEAEWINPVMERKLNNTSRNSDSRDSDNNIQVEIDSRSSSSKVTDRQSWMMAAPVRESSFKAERHEEVPERSSRENDLIKKIEEEVKLGLRDPVSKLPYGLFQPKKREKDDNELKGVEGFMEREGKLVSEHKGAGSSFERRETEKRRQEQGQNALLYASKGSGITEDATGGDGVHKGSANTELDKSVLVGDGGASWRRKAAQRVQEKAKKEVIVEKERNNEDNVSKSYSQRVKVDNRNSSSTSSQPRWKKEITRRDDEEEEEERRRRNNKRERSRSRSPRRRNSYDKDINNNEKEERYRKDRGEKGISNFNSKDYPTSVETSSIATTAPPIAAATSTTTSTYKVEDLNLLNAQLMKAEMMGNTAKATELRNAISNLTSASNNTKANTKERNMAEEEEEDVVVIPNLDREGRVLTSLSKKYDITRDDLRNGSRQGKTKAANLINKDSSKRGYFQSDEKNSDLSISDLRRMEKSGDPSGDIDSIYAKNILKKGADYRDAKESRSGMDEEDELDVTMYESKDSRLTDLKRQEKDRAKAIHAHQQHNKAIESCISCVESNVFKKHLMISLAEHSYLALVPPSVAITSNHMRIVPLKHLWAFTDAEEEVWAELSKWKESVEAMCHGKDEGVIYMETVVGQPGKRHCVIDVIPVERQVEEDVPLIFKKEIMECDDEWQAANRKCIDTGAKGLRRCIPPSFPYFHIEWSNLTGPSGGYCHCVEDEEIFKPSFGKDTLASMINEDGRTGRHSKENQARKTFEYEKKAVLAILKEFEPFDWTSALDGGGY